MALPNKRRLRIAFGNICTKEWIAGCHYLRNLFIALKSTGDQPEIVLYGASADDSQDILKDYVDQILISPVHRVKPIHLAFRVERRLGIQLGMSRYEASFLRKHGINVFFTQLDQGQSFNIPLIAWLTDFQHLHLPEM